MCGRRFDRDEIETRHESPSTSRPSLLARMAGGAAAGARRARRSRLRSHARRRSAVATCASRVGRALAAVGIRSRAHGHAARRPRRPPARRPRRALGPPTADPRRCGARPPARRPPVARSRDWHAESWMWHAAARTWHRLLAAMPFDFLREFLARESTLKIAVAAARSGGPWLPGYRHLGVHCVGRSQEVAPVEGL